MLIALAMAALAALAALPLLAAEDCSRRTKVFQEWGPENTDYRYYDPRSYGASLHAQRPDRKMDKGEYAAMVDGIACVGRWCLNRTHQWGCGPGDNKECYNTHRIISPRSDIPALRDCSPTDYDVAGNYIKAYGRWAQSLSAGSYAERRAVYGRLLGDAYRAVCRSCAADCDTAAADPAPVPDCDSDGAAGHLHLLLTLFMGAALLAFVALGSYRAFARFRASDIEMAAAALDSSDSDTF